MRNCFSVGTQLKFKDMDGVFEVADIVGKGASSIVYRAIHIDGSGKRTEHLLKEYNPSWISTQRDGNGNLVVEDEFYKRKFNQGLERFEQSFKLQGRLREDPELKNYICNIQGIHSGYGTKFIDMTEFHGHSYDHTEEVSFSDLLKRTRTITRVVSLIHKKGYLYLDIKPENIFIFPQTCDLIMFFDFDSLVEKAQLQNGNTRLSCTRKWAPPELLSDNPGCYINEKSDYYSIGMVFFFKLMGRLPDRNTEQNVTAEYIYNCSSGLLRNANEKTLFLLSNFFHHTICLDVQSRWENPDTLIAALDEMEKSLNCESDPQSEKNDKQEFSHIINRQLSKLSRAIILAAVLIGVSVAGLALSLALKNRNNAAVPSLNTPHVYTEGLENAVQAFPEKNPATNALPESTAIADSPEDVLQNNELVEDVSVPDGFTYTIDTVAANLTQFRSMVMDQSGTVYYIDGDQIYNTKNDVQLDLANDFNEPLENPYLAYDPYNDVVYLLAGKHLALYNITDFDTPQLVLDQSNCESLVRFQLKPESYITPRIAVLENGALLVPSNLDGTYQVNPTQKTATRTIPIYDFGSSGYYAHVIDSDVITYCEGDNVVEVRSLFGGEAKDIQLQVNMPVANACAVASNALILYQADKGLYQVNTKGEGCVLAEKAQIQVLDYQSLDYCNIWAIAANDAGMVAFYDNSLHCIRLLSPN